MMEVCYEITCVSGEGMGLRGRMAEPHKSNGNHAGVTVNNRASRKEESLWIQACPGQRGFLKSLTSHSQLGSSSFYSFC